MSRTDPCRTLYRKLSSIWPSSPTARCPLYAVNDNLFTIIDALMNDPRWDMKFLGMQIMIESLALGAFGTLYRLTTEPLHKELLRYIIQDEAPPARC